MRVQCFALHLAPISSDHQHKLSALLILCRQSQNRVSDPLMMTISMHADHMSSAHLGTHFSIDTSTDTPLLPTPVFLEDR